MTEQLPTIEQFSRYQKQARVLRELCKRLNCRPEQLAEKWDESEKRWAELGKQLAGRGET